VTRIDRLLTGPAKPFGPRAAPSGIDKRPVAGRTWLGREGFTGDEQGDRKHHGGPEKAVHHYAFEHYAPWREAIGARDVLTRPGAFGENLSTTGLSEAQIAIGDTFRAGGALIQVSQGRQRCWKLNLRFGVPDMAFRVQASGRTGWYYRVIEEGFVEAGDDLVLVERISPEWTIERLWREQGPLPTGTCEPHVAEHAGSEEKIGVGDRGAPPDRPRTCVESIVGEVERAAPAIRRLILQADLHRRRLGTAFPCALSL